jgi:hypothetical protein
VFEPPGGELNISDVTSQDLLELPAVRRELLQGTVFSSRELASYRARRAATSSPRVCTLTFFGMLASPAAIDAGNKSCDATPRLGEAIR